LHLKFQNSGHTACGSLDQSASLFGKEEQGSLEQIGQMGFR